MDSPPISEYRNQYDNRGTFLFIVVNSCNQYISATSGYVNMGSRLRQKPPENGSYAELTGRLSRDLINEACVLFVGAGSTTERWQHGPKFCSTIRAMVAEGNECESLIFPELMQLFCEKKDGGHHHLLVREAINYLETYMLPGPSNEVASELSRLLASIPVL